MSGGDDRQVSRRRLLIGVGVGGSLAVTGVGASTLFDLFGAAPALSALDRDDVASQIGTRLSVGELDETTSLGELVVDEIVELPIASTEPARQFAFRMTADRRLGLAQDTYRVSHRRFGTTLLFLSRLDDGVDGSERYEVMVNRPSSPERQEVAS